MESYTYDGASRLTGITWTKSATTLGDLTYTYNGNGRRVQMGGSLAQVNLPTAVASATYNAANQLTQWGATSLTYDFNGNLTSDGTNTYTWDARNQLSSISGGASASFQYDGFGRRTRNAAGTGFLYDGVNAVQELSGQTITANLLTGFGIDEVFSRADAGGTWSFLADALGSTRALTDSAGTMQTQYTYEPFGKTTASGPASSNPFQSTGRENDGTGLFYYRARYYHTTLQRFISEDPLEFGGGDVNLYAYVANDPINLIDPSGLTWTSNWNYFWDWTLGRGPRRRTYGPTDIETAEMQRSPAAQRMRDQFEENNCQTTRDFSYGTARAYWDTIANPSTADWSSTSAEVGGFAGASVTNNGNGTATFYIPNVSGTHSFFFHVVPDRKSPTGPMSNIYQYFQWTVPIGGRKDKQGCR